MVFAAFLVGQFTKFRAECERLLQRLPGRFLGSEGGSYLPQLLAVLACVVSAEEQLAATLQDYLHRGSSATAVATVVGASQLRIDL